MRAVRDDCQEAEGLRGAAHDGAQAEPNTRLCAHRSVARVACCGVPAPLSVAYSRSVPPLGVHEHGASEGSGGVDHVT